MPGSDPLLCYCLIGKNSVILVEAFNNSYAVNTETQDLNLMATLATKVFATISSDLNDRKQTLQDDDYAFHYVSENGMIYMVLADKDMDQFLAFRFLLIIRDQWVSGKSQLEQGGNDMRVDNQDDFVRFMQRKLLYYSNPSVIKTEKIKDKTNEVKDIMRENLIEMEERGEKLEVIERKAALLEDDTESFGTVAKSVKSKVYWKNFQLTIILIVVIICGVGCIAGLIILIAIVVIVVIYIYLKEYTSVFNNL